MEKRNLPQLSRQPAGFQSFRFFQGIASEKGGVPHFPHADGAAFSVEVEGGGSGFQQGCPVRWGCLAGPEVAKKVEHHAWGNKLGGAEREAEDDAELLLELGAGAGVDGVVAGVVGARSHLVDHEGAVVIHEKLDP